MPDWTLRTARTDDIPAIRELDRALFHYDRNFDPTLDATWPDGGEAAGWYAERVAGEGLLLVAEAEGVMAGYLIAQETEPESYREPMRMAEMEAFFIAEKWRGGGLGAAMVQAFETWAKGRGCVRTQVVVSAANAGAIRFYERQGMNRWDVVMEKVITSGES